MKIKSAKKKSKIDYYTMEEAINYDAKRAKQPSRKKELASLDYIIGKYTPEHITDVPVGTGFAFPVYEKYGCSARGIDISEDMLKQARKKNKDFILEKGSIFDSELGDFIVCIRLLNFFNKEKQIEILSRTKKYIFFIMRLRRRGYPENLHDRLNKAGLELIEKIPISKKDNTIYSAYFCKKK